VDLDDAANFRILRIFSLRRMEQNLRQRDYRNTGSSFNKISSFFTRVLARFPDNSFVARIFILSARIGKEKPALCLRTEPSFATAYRHCSFDVQQEFCPSGAFG